MRTGWSPCPTPAQPAARSPGKGKKMRETSSDFSQGDGELGGREGPREGELTRRGQRTGPSGGSQPAGRHAGVQSHARSDTRPSAYTREHTQAPAILERSQVSPTTRGAPTRRPHWALPVRAEYFPFFPSLLPALARSARPESPSPSNSYWTCQCALPVPWLNPTLTPSFHLHTGPGTRDSPRPKLSPSGVRDKISWSLEHLCP